MATGFAEVEARGSYDLRKRTLPLADTPELRQAVEEGEIHTLLMTYVHISRDESMLDRFAPHIKSPYAYPPEAIPAELQDELRAKLLQVLVTPGAPEDEPADALMHRMMTIGLSEPVDDEFLPLLYDQIGFRKETPRKELPGRKPADPTFKVLVIGAGMTGLAAGVKLDEAGYTYEIIEKNEEVGGTWWENRYPGVGVDTPSHFYSFSFALNPDWNNYHPQGNDMFAYLKRVADEYGLRSKIRFNTTVETLIWDNDAGVWNVTVRGKDGSQNVIQANAVINGHGPVNRFKWPDIPGLETFQGKRLHTATWDTSLDLKGKRVAVVGTGASAAQLIPAVADDVSELYVFQRSRHWVMPSPAMADDVVTDGVKYAMRHIPHYLEWYRFRIYWFAADGLYPNVLLDPEWPADSPSVSALNDGMRTFALGHIQRTFADRPDLQEKMTPDFPVFSKRIILDRGPYFTTFLKPNVHLEQAGIEKITPTGVVTKDGREIEIDVLICATGFDVANMMGNLEIVGVDGKRLRDEWGVDDARGYFGLTVPGFPNYFHTTGPNSAPNHAAGQNLISERQVNYIIECLDWLNAEGKSALQPKQDAFEAWQEKVEGQMTKMIWSHPRANSYYNNKKKRNFLSWPWRLVDFWNECRGPRKADFDLQ